MMQYENDDRAILRVLDGLAEGQIIDHGTARTIASQYNEPGICESFVSTGAIPSGESDGPDSFSLIYALFDGTAEHPEYGLRAAKALEEYIEDRSEAGEFAPVDGWSGMWVPKQAQSGYAHCACRDCMEIIVANNPARPELCDECNTAGCGDPAAQGWPECQRDDAYGDDSERSCGCGGAGVHGVDHED